MHLLEIKNLEKSYGGRKVVGGVNLAIQRSEIVGLLGPNGAGKTTTFNMVTGLVKADRGEIFFDQQNVINLSMHEHCRRGIGYLTQDASIFRKLTVEENIMGVLETLFISMRERQRRLEILLGELNITHLRRNKALTLSGGERRRLEITRALVTNPQFVLLDEPFSGIDPIAVFECQQIITELKARGIGVLLTDHNVRETLAITDRSYIMSEGKILISGTSEDLISSPKAREIYLGEKFRM
ncbi:MAG: LPS export ABC transporter ATP-binding protein [Candidatus Omnitrophica bacterium]|nr:LPS export ABC transporter ATP-binding protein [Candidatus Omnitrophota bacterium]